MAKVLSHTTSVGGRSCSATSGGYNQGGQFAAQHGSRSVGQKMDLRKGNAAGPGPSAANPGSGYNQGDQFAASTGATKVGSHKDLRGGNANSGSGYNQGMQFGGTTK